ncbi:hypothetical protein Cgig2_012091 [Carnegiea gigantea]|uniref:Myb/SANT-like domain-containing protein n=1 Tax=Carnegiea gigantea TaxID=171969 RepID=A0A9Q1JKE9_9CARY|nr:hypothetical protein Cgig2_012091 [Carnegiea gigantea]
MALENNEIKKGGVAKEFLSGTMMRQLSYNGRGQSIKWCEIEKEVTQKIGRPCATNCCKHKYDAMRKDWRAWKQLRNTKTGLGWDPLSGKIEATTEWWDKKIKENQYIKKFRDKVVSSLLEEKWEHIYGGTYATGKNVYVPTMEPPLINVEEQGEGRESEKHIGGQLGEEDNLYMYNLQDNPYFQLVLADEDQFFIDFIEYMSNGNDDNTKPNSEDGPSAVNNQLLSTQVANKNVSRRAQKSALKTKTVQLKRNRRHSGGSAMLGAQIKHMVASCRIMSQGGPNRMNKQASSMSTIAMAMQIINRMCYATHVLEDAVKREIFLNMDDDDSRIKWLQYFHRMKDN